MLANAHFETLLGKRLGKLSRLLHTRETFGRVDVEGIGIDRFAMVDRVTDGLKEAKLETVAAFNTNAQVGEDKEALMRAIDVLEVVETGDARSARITSFAVVEQVQFLVGVGVAQHGIHEKIGVLQVPGLVFPSIAEGGRDGQSSPDAGRFGKVGTMTWPSLNGWCDRRAVDGVGLANGTIVGDDAKLDDGSGVDGTSIGLFADTAHARLLGLFADGQLVFNVVAIGGHLLNGDILVGDAVLGSGTWGRAGSTVIGFGHGGAVLRRDGVAATIEVAHVDGQLFPLGLRCDGEGAAT